MIKKYFEFSEYNDHNTLGEYIEKLSENDEFIRMIVGEYTKDTDPKIRISNAVNILNDFDKIELLKRVESHLNNDVGETDITTTVDVDEIIQESYGKNVFSTFLKCLTALGMKDNLSSKNTPNDFLMIFKFENLDYLKVESVFGRFKSLSSIDIKYEPNMGLYIGIKNGSLEYGYLNEKTNQIGTFSLSNRNLNWIKTSNLKSLSGIKKSLSDLSSNDLNLMCKIKDDFLKFEPDHVDSKMTPRVDDRIISFGYYGVGGWNNGVMSESDLLKFKELVKSYLSNFRWSDKVLLSVVSMKFWIYVKIKIK